MGQGAAANSVPRPLCRCLDPQYEKGKWSELKLHTDQQHTTCSGWTRLLELIDQAANDNREEFSPGREMTPEQWSQITTLPASIGKLKSVKHLILYGSSLVRIPPEIGEMSSLQQFSPYTSYRLHWFPFEILRCTNLKRSTVSTRALWEFQISSTFSEAAATTRSVHANEMHCLRLLLWRRCSDAVLGIVRRCHGCSSIVSSCMFHEMFVRHSYAAQRLLTDTAPRWAWAEPAACRLVTRRWRHNQRLKLTDHGVVPTGQREEIPESPVVGALLPNGTYLLYINDEIVPDDQVLSRLSKGASLIACYANETVMNSYACAWESGVERWSVFHDARSFLINYDLFRTHFKNRSVRNTPEDGSA
jgi:hypothetical protein